MGAGSHNPTFPAHTNLAHGLLHLVWCISLDGQMIFHQLLLLGLLAILTSVLLAILKLWRVLCPLYLC
jgi:hypothetical protein